MGKPELKIDPELIQQARAAGVNVDYIAERAIRLELQRADPAGAEARARKWAEENAEAIADYNRRIRERGLIGDEFRKW
ncbi:MAG: type II toxin-antitoxin system CcdA family antitoxin [Phenylobacterium sp.]|uniref:type II toxin-antitoxin system CcdA family antitoxin n=1 Tax=Phenylobacterium sp. TaxID=1871053 RepID=UPI001A4973FC|nr:type II toxin-antitoxin system CcdA family antitoxin [Phenylobacterium sp.]MBL8556060.1 type II toxin-antitoxin system CcdA family antitoxin [Phenylobacterium sp.]